MDNIVERIRSLCKRKGTSLTKLEVELGFGNGTIGKWAKGTPNYSRVKAVADYFGISVSELTGEQKEPPPAEPEAADPVKQQLYEIIEKMSRGQLMLLLEKAQNIENL